MNRKCSQNFITIQFEFCFSRTLVSTLKIYCLIIKMKISFITLLIIISVLNSNFKLTFTQIFRNKESIESNLIENPINAKNVKTNEIRVNDEKEFKKRIHKHLITDNQISEISDLNSSVNSRNNHDKLDTCLKELNVLKEELKLKTMELEHKCVKKQQFSDFRELISLMMFRVYCDDQFIPFNNQFSLKVICFTIESIIRDYWHQND